MKFEKVSRLRAKFPFVAKRNTQMQAENIDTEIAVDEKGRESKPDKVTKNKYLLDASICGIEGIICFIKSIMEFGFIVLTSVSIRELEQMQRFKDLFGRDAKQILAIAAQNEEHTECVLIDESFPIADDAIINYCAQHKEEVILLTADKTMALKARAFGCEVKFFQQSPEANNSVRTLYSAKKVDGKLVIDELQNAYRSITVISDGRIYTQGHLELHIGDNLFICSKKGYGGIMFTHFRVINLNDVDNVIQVYHRRISYTEYLKDLSPIYLDVIKDFKRRFDM